MRLIRRIVAPLALSLAVSAAASAATVTIGFNNPALDSNAPPGYSESGLQFSPTLDFYGAPFSTIPTIPSLSIYVLAQVFTSLTAVDGQLFTLDSIDSASILPNPANYGEDFVIIYFPTVGDFYHETVLSIPYVNQSGFSAYQLPPIEAAAILFYGVEFPGGGPPTMGAYYDNLVITPDLGPPHPPLPEPATWVLMILGLGLAGARIRAARQSCLA